MEKTILLADSGGTTTTWLAVTHQQIRRLSGPGLQPYFLPYEQIQSHCREIADQIGAAVQTLFFYGAGLGHTPNQQTLYTALTSSFPGANIEVHSDMLGAARALWQQRPGVAAILGTGANTCYYDGNTADIRRPGFGYVLGDEGSGAVLGKHLLKSWLYRRMPQDLRQAFEAFSSLTPAKALEAIYTGPAPNRFLGSLAPFAAEYRTHPFIANLLRQHFMNFFDQMLDVYAADGLRTVGCCGSIAWHFREELIRCGKERQFEVVDIQQDPTAGLLRYHCPQLS